MLCFSLLLMLVLGTCFHLPGNCFLLLLVADLLILRENLFYLKNQNRQMVLDARSGFLLLVFFSVNVSI